ncbi:MAG: S8 family serine peptidase [Thiolinea sp.]
MERRACIRYWFTNSLFVAALAANCLAGANAASYPAAARTDNLIDQLIIHYQPDAQTRLARSSDPEFMARLTEQTVTAATGLQVSYKRAMSAKIAAHVLRLPYAMSVDEAERYARQLVQQQPDIDYAEPDYRRYPQSTIPNDTNFNQQWHLMSPAEYAGASNVVNAWDLSKGSTDIVVAVLDSGGLDHPDLLPNLVGGSVAKSGYDMVDREDISGDGDGRDSDPSNPGTDESSAVTSLWHGTHISGILAARPDNNKFGAGVAWQSKLLLVRILSEQGGYLSDQVDGMLWAAGEAVPGVPDNTHPARILNLSAGGQDFQDCSRTEQNAVNILRKMGVVIVVAAGNAGKSVAGSPPANCNGVIAVAGVMPDGARTPYTNYGELNDIAAPAEQIYSTSNSGLHQPQQHIFKAVSGTSQAAPQVAGTLALMLAANKKLLDKTVISQTVLPDLLEDKLKRSARSFPTDISGSADPDGCNINQEVACVCTTDNCGAGLLDAFQAVKAVSTPPQAVAGSDQMVAATADFTLDGSRSADDSYGGKIRHYQWQQVSGPDVALNNATAAKANFTAPAAAKNDTQLVFRLTVTDDVGLQNSDEVVITVPGKGGGGSLPLSVLAALAGLLWLRGRWS